MKTTYRLILHSRAANYLCDKRLFKKPNKPLFDLIIHKIAKLLHFSARRCVFAYPALLKIKHMLTEQNNKFDEEIEKYNKAIEKKGVDLANITQAENWERSVRIENPIIFDFVMLIERFDHLMCVMNVARNTGVFTQKNTYLKLMAGHKREINLILTKIIQIPVLKMPKITINEYMENSDKYKIAQGHFGDINPNDLFNAIQLAGTPLMRTDEMNRVKAALKEKLM